MMTAALQHRVMRPVTSLLLAVSITLSSNVWSVCGEFQGVFGDESAGYGPVFEDQPVDTIYPEESPEEKITMSCRARANPPATYRWKLNSTDILIRDGSDDHYRLMGGNLVISDPDRSKHSGNYTCEATNEFGTVISQRASVQFGYLDMFSTDEREAVYVKEGQGAVLLCAPPPHFPEDLSFRWMLNEFPEFIPMDKRRFVSQATGNLYISTVRASDSGNYSCFVSSPSIAKSVFSKFIPLVPITERSLRKYPADIKVKSPDTHTLIGQNITLECFALGNPIPQIRWRKVDGELPVNRHDISMAGSLLHLYDVQYEDEGLYECEADNSKGKDWHKLHLIVEGAPEWIEKITSSERDINSDYIMSCLASGKPKPHVHFLKNGRTFSMNHEIRLNQLSFDDSGMYQCFAENRHGVIYTSAELRVFAGAPSFEFNPVKPKILVAKNGRVVMECKPRAAPRPNISWSKGTELLHNSSRMFIWPDGSLEIVNVTKSDEGKYTCFAENDRGRANGTGSLSVTDATKITLAPSNRDVSVGESTTMECAASHDPTLDLTFIWSLNAHVLDLDRDREYYEHKMDINQDGQMGTSSCELLIRNTQLKHAGRYTCTAQTPVDNITTSAELVVRGPPGPPGGVRVDDVLNSSVRVTWSHGTDNLSPISTYTIQYRDTRTQDDWRDAKTSPVIVEGNSEMATVVNLTPWTEYEFRVIATNTLGTGPPSDPSPKTTTKQAKPVVAPSDISGGGGTSRELTITWTPVQPQYYYGSNFGYIIAFRPHNEHEWLKVTVADPQAQKYVHKDSNIPPATKFEVKMKAFNSQGEGPYSVSAFIYSAQDVLSDAPTIVEARTLSATEAIVWWIPVQSQTVEGYQVRYWCSSTENEASAQRVLVSGRENHTRLENMKPDSHYLIEVRAYNGAGYGPAGQRHEIYTKKPPPNRPPKIIGTKMHSSGTSINIAWEHVRSMSNESAVVGYKVLYRREGQSNAVLYTTVKQSIDVPIKKGEYLVEVRAHSEGGDGAVAQVRITGGGVLMVQSLSIVSLLITLMFSFIL
ncbi:contactin-1a-like isoform X1 [Myxocyprinus asiaticus]|uniref:contactin-1a-like isoform X1 n=1 Tax=Myxocyprinus asiaticus TaxID=70543 RepID=UPI0022226ADD|nr:contactin-1a-like isoform X1 [Myxocyprinus asiaticus]XP_051546221.1 contactin-1a-like isoform X1 [Myxocyprinus asiaticus]XP_051546223.1 contactin-1a-like isoform X1 [Myxocyprinus asiaticus]